MADNYLEFSEVIPRLTTEEEAWLKSQLEQICVIDGVEYPANDVTEELQGKEPQWLGCRAYRDMDDYDADFSEGVGFECAFHDDASWGAWGRHAWLHTVEYADLGRVAHLVKKFLKKFRPDDTWSLTYANTCSKPRVGEFGGGAVFVTATKIKWHDARDFVGDQTGVCCKSRPAIDSVAADHCRIVVSICGGVIQDVYCSDPQAKTTIVDWDNEDCEPTANGIIEVRIDGLGKTLVYVADYLTQSLKNLSGTDVERALRAANCRDSSQGPEGGAA